MFKALPWLIMFTWGASATSANFNICRESDFMQVIGDATGTYMKDITDVVFDFKEDDSGNN